MLQYLIMCRSVTYAQKVVQTLERAGIRCRMIRSPSAISPSGCSYSVRIAQKDLSTVLTLLYRFRLPYVGIYVGSSEAGYREVEL